MGQIKCIDEKIREGIVKINDFLLVIQTLVYTLLVRAMIGQ